MILYESSFDFGNPTANSYLPVETTAKKAVTLVNIAKFPKDSTG